VSDWRLGFRLAYQGPAATTFASALPPDTGVRIPLLPDQIPEFGFHFCRIGYRLRDLLPEEVAVALAEPMNGDLERAFRRAHFASQRGIRRGLIEQEDLQPVEMVQASVHDELGPDSVQDSVEH
jgi:hypothetical protein